MLEKVSLIITFLVFCFLPFENLHAAGLSTAFSEVMIENLGAGNDYSTQKVAGMPLVVVNTGDEPVDLKMEVLIPDIAELKEGFEPIPDLSWIKLEKKNLKE